jgi:Predicted NADH:ubiquinone oxidoreductase, subunit RnfC
MAVKRNITSAAGNVPEMVKSAGVVGAGGAGFPTHVKLAGKAEIVVVNGAECEPILETDRHLMLREAEKVVTGLGLVMSSVGATKGIIAVKRKHKDIAGILRVLLKNTEAIEMFELDNFYPAGDEHVLVYETTGRVVPMGGIPLDVGVVVSNVYTLSLVSDSMEGKNFTHRYVTVAGEVNRPAVARLPIGISIREAIEKVAGGTTITKYNVVTGGPMMGKLEDNLDKPVTKTTGGIIVLPEDHRIVQTKKASIKAAVRRSKSVCCQCSFCTEMCPRFLLGHNLKPHKLIRLMPGIEGSIDMDSIYMASLCSECGLCSFFSCTMGLSPSKVNSFFKGILAQSRVRPDFKAMAVNKVDEFRQYRKVSTSKLIGRLDLTGYDFHLPFIEEDIRPKTVTIPLKQHIGAPCVPVVKNGDRVAAGDLLGKVQEGSLGANIHSSIDGKVKEIGENVVIERL